VVLELDQFARTVALAGREITTQAFDCDLRASRQVLGTVDYGRAAFSKLIANDVPLADDIVFSVACWHACDCPTLARVSIQ
jgi:hypothetical protein